jgi:XrtJ-associated TM-motif-TM protein
MKTSNVLPLLAFFLCCTLPAAAQSGCIDSPENPTVILAVVGFAGFAVSNLRAHYGARRGGGKVRRTK